MAALFVFDQRRRKQRTFKDRISSLDHLSDVEVVDRYRLSRIAIIYLEENLRNDLSPPTNRSQSVSSMTKMLVGLRVLSKGNFLSEVADLHGISKQTASRVLYLFVDAVNRNIDNIRCSRRNTRPYHFPERQWRSLHMPEMIPCYKCDGYMFIDIVAKWPGSQHDSSVMNTSSLKVDTRAVMRKVEGVEVFHRIGKVDTRAVMGKVNRVEVFHGLGKADTRAVMRKVDGVGVFHGIGKVDTIGVRRKVDEVGMLHGLGKVDTRVVMKKVEGVGVLHGIGKVDTRVVMRKVERVRVLHGLGKVDPRVVARKVEGVGMLHGLGKDDPRGVMRKVEGFDSSDFRLPVLLAKKTTNMAATARQRNTHKEEIVTTNAIEFPAALP
ncbi:hypothetical protein MAR_012045, partial [Mya arenaria]